MNFVFDLYGTLIDIWTDESVDELWEGIALLLGDGEERAEQVREEYLTLCCKAYKGGYHELDLLSVFRLMLEKRGVDTSVAPSLALEFRRMSMIRLGLFDGVKNMLCELRSHGGRIYLLSNAQSCFTFDELHTTGIYDLFDGIVISSDIGVKKPSPDAFEKAFEILEITADDSIYIGNDMRDDILGASSVGMKTVYIQTEQSGSYPELDLPQPTYRVKDHLEMTELLLSLI